MLGYRPFQKRVPSEMIQVLEDQVISTKKSIPDFDHEEEEVPSQERTKKPFLKASSTPSMNELSLVRSNSTLLRGNSNSNKKIVADRRDVFSDHIGLSDEDYCDIVTGECFITKWPSANSVSNKFAIEDPHDNQSDPREFEIQKSNFNFHELIKDYDQPQKQEEEEEEDGKTEGEEKRHEQDILPSLQAPETSRRGSLEIVLGLRNGMKTPHNSPEKRINVGKEPEYEVEGSGVKFDRNDSLSHQAQSMVLKLLKINPDLRISSLDQLLEEEFMKGFDVKSVLSSSSNGPEGFKPPIIPRQDRPNFDVMLTDSENVGERRGGGGGGRRTSIVSSPDLEGSKLNNGNGIMREYRLHPSQNPFLLPSTLPHVHHNNRRKSQIEVDLDRSIYILMII